MFDLKLLEKLCKANGISGDEHQVRDIIFENITNTDVSITTDALGNLIVFKKGKERPKNKLMISAHMDEIGLIATNITKDGYVKFETVGGIDSKVLPGKRVVSGNNVKGVINSKPPHLLSEEEIKSVFKASQLYIDIGCTRKDEAEKLIGPGDGIYFNSIFESSNGRILSKALDNRAGCFILLSMINEPLPYDMYFAFVVQEEVGLRGAKTAAYAINPDYALVVEATTASDLPSVSKENHVCKLGGGAVVSIMDKKTIYPKELYQLAFSCAEHTQSKIQVKTSVTGGNDAGSIHISRAGVKTLSLSVPCRYIHAPVSMVLEEDICSTLTILKEISKRICALSAE